MKFLIIIAALLFAGCATRPGVRPGIPNFAVVERGVYRGGQPQTLEDWRWLYSVGVRDVVKLNTHSEGDDVARALGMHVYYYPIDFVSQTVGKPDPREIKEAADVVYFAHLEHVGVYVHCSHGQDRTGLVVGNYRLIEGWSKYAAYREMVRYGFHPQLRGLCWSWEEDAR